MIWAASACDVWSFQSQAWAARFSLNSLRMASGIPSRPTGMGVEPVVSTPIPTIPSAEKPGRFFAAVSAPRTDLKNPSM